MDLLIYSHKDSPRLSYILRLLLNEVLGLTYSITHDSKQFNEYKGPKINYSGNQLNDKSIQIIPHKILFENTIKKQDINISVWDNIKVFFQSPQKCDIPFDIFAASFYLASRYEEYLPFKEDKYGRFEANESLAFNNGFLEEPVVNQWAIKLKGILRKTYPGLTIEEKKFKYISTIDVDNAWAYLHKGFLRTAGAFGKSIFKFDFKDYSRRFQTLTGNCKDPYYTFDYISEQENNFDFSSIYFFLTGKYGKYDRNISLGKPAFQNLILDKQEKAETGIHNSYNSGKHLNILNKEIKQFEKALNTKVEKSRQHYLVIKFPDTFQKLMQLGIQEDYSLGYSSAVGFRAGICNSFKFYDLTKDKETNLTIIPFHIMDITLREYMKLQPDKAINKIKDIILRIKNVNGTFVSLWHNESLSEITKWKGWRRVYEEMLDCIYD